MGIRIIKQRYFGSRTSDGHGLHNIRAAEFFILLKLLESCYLHNNLTARIISSRCVDVTKGYIGRRTPDFTRWGLIARTPIPGERGCLCYCYRLLQPGRKFVESIPVNIYNRLFERLAIKNADLMSLKDSRLSGAVRLEHSAITRHNKIVVRNHLSQNNDPQPQPKPAAQPVTPIKHQVEFVHFSNAAGSHFVADLSKPNFNFTQVDYTPRFTIEGNSAAGARHYFGLIKSGELRLAFVDGQIVED